MRLQDARKGLAMAAKKEPVPYERMQFSLPRAITVELTELVGELRVEARRKGERVPSMSEIVAAGLEREIAKRRKALEKRQQR